MKMVKSLILGSAAALVAMSGAQAADLPVKAKAVEYVKVCSLYGAGFWYIPGTDTCLRVGGQMRFDVGFNTSNTYDAPKWQGGAGGFNTRGEDYYQTRARVGLQIDTRTATEYGVLRTFADVKFDWANTRENVAGGFAETDYAFIQFAGFTIGKAVSMFDAPWVLAVPTINSYVIGASSVTTGLPMVAYTAQFGNGVSGTISLEDGGRNYRQEGVWNTNTSVFGPGGVGNAGAPTYGTAPNTFTGNYQYGVKVPDIVGNIRFEQQWGSFHVAAAAHNVGATYYSSGATFTAASNTALETNGHPDSKWGYAVSGAIEIKNIPTGLGDSLKVDATYAHGAPKYVFGSVLDTIGGGRFGRDNFANSTIGFGYVFDGVFTGTAAPGTQTGINLSTSYGARAFFNHVWTPQWSTSLWGAWAHNEFGAAGNAAIIAGLNGNGVNTGGGAGYVGALGGLAGNGSIYITGGDTKLNIYQAGTTTTWTPVKDLSFSAQFTYARIDQNLVGAYFFPAAGGSASVGVRTFADQNTYSGAFRVLRSF